jgi:hypothetical protein
MKLAAHPFMYHITSDVTNPTIKDESFLLLSRVSCSYTVLPPRDIVFHLPFSLSSSSLHTFRGPRLTARTIWPFVRSFTLSVVILHTSRRLPAQVMPACKRL